MANRVAKANVLVVGAGGIGCELLKDLILSGFCQISTIDMDTIECSNLNRQFLFRTEHVGQSKAKVAAMTAIQFAPPFNSNQVSLVPIHDSVTDPKYDVEFYKKFHLVIGALDNAEARRHVNRMCLIAGVTYIDCGTSGRLGQVRVIVKGQTECYQCVPKAAEKQYPVCTIRSTPSEPVHCIVWAKYLFNRLFGEFDPSEEVSPEALETTELSGDSKAEQEVAKLADSWHAKINVTIENYAKGVDYDAKKILHKLFFEDIEYLRQVTYKHRKLPPPETLDVEKLFEAIETTPPKWDSWVGREQTPWTVPECAFMAAQVLSELRKRRDCLPEGACIAWDKDDSHAVDFVTAFANLRCSAFHLQMQSRFDVQSIAGRIVPAVAATNATIAGLATMKAIEILSRKPLVYSTICLAFGDAGPRLVPEYVNPPKENCYACSGMPRAISKVNLETFTVRELSEKILQKHFAGFNFDVLCLKPTGSSMIISSDPDELTGLLSKTLKDCGLENGVRLCCEDVEKDFKLEVTIFDCNADELPAEGFLFEQYKKVVAAETDETTDSEEVVLEEPLPKRSRSDNNV